MSSDISRHTYPFWLSFLIMVAIAVSGCGENGNRQFLDNAETGIAVNPDSILALLQNTDTTRFVSAADNARFHLLMAEARYKAGIKDTITDHLDAAVAYYKNHGPRHDAARAFFYSGLVKSNRNLHPTAIIDLLRAEKIALADNDTMRLALIYRSIGDTFIKVYNWENAFSYYEKSQQYFEAANAYDYSNYAYYDMARSCLALDNFTLAIKYAQMAYQYGNDINDPYLMKYSLTVLACSYWYLNEYDKAYKVYSDIYGLYENLMIAQDYFHLGMLHLHFGEIDKAREMEKKLAAIDSDDKELQICLMIYDKNYQDAIKGLYSTIDRQNKAFGDTRSSNLTTEIIKYERNEEQILQAAHRRERTLWICILSLAGLSLGLIIILLTRKNKILSMKRDADMEAISRLNDTVSNSRVIIRDLMAVQFIEFSELCQTYFQYEGHKGSQVKIYNKVNALISRFNSDSHAMAEIETRINASLNNLMKNFRHDFPTLNDWEYPLFMYNVCGLEPKIIALFLDLKPELIHKRKANLKRKVASSNSPRKDDYLSFLD